MSKQPVKLKSWPFKNGEQAQLTWINSTFLQNKKIMIYVYFRLKGRTENLLADWGTLPALAIHHYYLSGDITKSIVPVGTDEIKITICKWSIYGYK